MPPSETIAPLLVNEKNARQMLGGVSAKSLYNWRQDGLPFVRLGSRVMFDPQDLRRWIEQQKQIVK